MSSFAELMAAKKAARLAAAEQAPSETVEETSNALPSKEEAPEPSEVTESSEPSIDWSKLSFKEKLELKKKGFTQPNSPATVKLQPEVNREQEGQETSGTEVSKPLSEDVGKVILLANEATKAEAEKVTEGELLSSEVPDSVHIIRRKIQDIQNLDGIALRSEMDELRKLLQVNPQACMYMLPEDLGLMVRQLRKITDNKVAQVLSTTRTTKARAAKEAPAKLSAEEMQAAFDDL